MNRKKIKNYLQLGILLFGISISLWNCEREDGFNSSVDTSSLKSYRIDKKEIPSIMGFINNSKAKTSFSCGNIDDNLIYTTIDSLGIQTYSFPFYVEETSEDTFYNFVVKTSSETVYQPFVFKYIASNGFEVGVDDFNTFEGALEIYHYDRFCGNGNTTGRTDDDSPCPTNTVGLYSGSGSNSAPGNNSNSSENNGPTGEDYYNNSGNTGASGFGSSTGGGGAIPCVVRVTWSCDTESSAPHSSANCSTVSVYCPPSYNRTDDPCEQQEDFSGATAVNNTVSCPRGYVQNSQGVCVKKPCEGDPVSNPQIAPQSSSGMNGGLHGTCTRTGSGCTANPSFRIHDGVDLANPFGAPIYAMYDGVATLATQFDDQGNVVKAGYHVSIISNVDGDTVRLVFFHMQEEGRVSGAVSAGDVIGYQGVSGNLGNAIAQNITESHVHVKARKNGEMANPLDYLTTNINPTTGEVTNPCQE